MDLIAQFRVMVTATLAVTMIATGAAAAGAPKSADRGGLQRLLDDVIVAGAIGALAEVHDERGVWRGTSGSIRYLVRRRRRIRPRARASLAGRFH